ncbi:MAG: DNA mismatch repair endonuclease MutL [Anaerolineaceae bacterium]
MPIQTLPDEVASQIAAGEVVERPASVVKELVENALDSGAHKIQIEIEGAGKRLIQVSDDGSGIPADELPLAVGRHATSKLHHADDLFHITTLGFRGEALASIGSVARLSLTSRSDGVDVGARLLVEGGHNGAVSSVGAPQGTVVRVEDLFYNVPARLKFLKQDSTERQQIDGLVMRYALAYPQVRFRLAQDGKLILQTSGNGDRREVLASLYGVDIARQMLAVMAEEEDVSMDGFISPISLTRSNRREITFFVNGRWVMDTPLTQAMVQAYHTLLMVGRYPMGVILLTLPPESVDVNVHPAKAEVRFRSPERVFSGVQRAVRRALLAYTPVPTMGLAPTWTPTPQPVQRSVDFGWEMAEEAGAVVEQVSSQPVESQTSNAAAPMQPSIPGSALPLLRLVGQVGATYLVAEAPDGLYLIDQHAAHERVLFERLMGSISGAIPSQTLLEPAMVQLAPPAARLLNDQLPTLSHLGFQVEVFGPATFLVRALPQILSHLDPAAALRVLVEDFEEDETPLQSELEARLAARVCKRAAVKAGQVLTNEEQVSLVRNLEACQSPRTCPHGRPTMIHLSVDLLERQFGRRGAR